MASQLRESDTYTKLRGKLLPKRELGFLSSIYRKSSSLGSDVFSDGITLLFFRQDYRIHQIIYSVNPVILSKKTIVNISELAFSPAQKQNPLASPRETPREQEKNISSYILLLLASLIQ